MIQLNLLYEDENLTQKIVKKLVQEKLVLDMTEIKNTNLVKMENEVVVNKKYILLTAITKSLLFNKIIDSLDEFYPKYKIRVYALPIVQMKHHDMKFLSENLESV